MSAFEPVIVQSDDDRVLTWDLKGGSNHIRCLLSGDDTAGRLSFFENTLAPGLAIARHVHHVEDEYWYMLDAGIEVQVGSEIVSVQANTVVAIPAETEHAVRNAGTSEARAIVITTPSGLEKFFAAMSALFASPTSTPEDFARVFEATNTTMLE